MLIKFLTDAVLLSLVSITLIDLVHPESCEKWLKTHLHLTRDQEYSVSSIARLKFDSFEQLMLNTHNCSHSINTKINLLSMGPITPHMISANFFDIHHVLASLNILWPIGVKLTNLNGFDLQTNPNSVFKKHTRLIMLILEDSNMAFYLNKTTWITNEYCTRDYFSHGINKLFADAEYLLFENLLYTQKVCPLVFSNASTSQIWFSAISSSLIYKNELEFLQVNESDTSIRNLNLLRIEVAYVVITERIISKSVFKYIKTLYISGFFYGIDSGLFTNLKHIKTIVLKADSLELTLNQGLNWLEHLNTDINFTRKKADLDRAIYIKLYEEAYAFKKLYAYPDTDLCMYKDFPHSRLIYPIVLSQQYLNCTCTIVWLIQYSRLYEKADYSAFLENVYLTDFNVQHCLGKSTCLLYTSPSPRDS